MKRSRKSTNKPPKPPKVPEGLSRKPSRARAPKVPDRLTWIHAQLARVDALAVEAGVRDIQGVGRLLGEMRQLRDMLDAELEAQKQADAGGTAAQLEARLVEALASVDEDRLRRVIAGATSARGVGDVGEWLTAGEGSTTPGVVSTDRANAPTRRKAAANGAN